MHERLLSHCALIRSSSGEVMKRLAETSSMRSFGKLSSSLIQKARTQTRRLTTLWKRLQGPRREQLCLSGSHPTSPDKLALHDLSHLGPTKMEAIPWRQPNQGARSRRAKVRIRGKRRGEASSDILPGKKHSSVIVGGKTQAKIKASTLGRNHIAKSPHVWPRRHIYRLPSRLSHGQGSSPTRPQGQPQVQMGMLDNLRYKAVLQYTQHHTRSPWLLVSPFMKR